MKQCILVHSYSYWLCTIPLATWHWLWIHHWRSYLRNCTAWVWSDVQLKDTTNMQSEHIDAARTWHEHGHAARRHMQDVTCQKPVGKCGVGVRGDTVLPGSCTTLTKCHSGSHIQGPAPDYQELSPTKCHTAHAHAPNWPHILLEGTRTRGKAVVRLHH